jgi:hypothetical protein
VGVVTFLGIRVVGVGGPLVVVLLRLRVVWLFVLVMMVVVLMGVVSVSDGSLVVCRTSLAMQSLVSLESQQSLVGCLKYSPWNMQ